MAKSGSTVWEVWPTSGSDGSGGGFNKANANMPTDLAGTSATGSSPVVSSASVTFVAGDAGAWVYVKSGTNWTPGFYKIASVASGQATLDAAVGHAVLDGSTTTPPGANASAGCATTASPSGGTFAIDYSQQSASKFSHATLSASAGSTSVTDSTGATWNLAMTGNEMKVSGGGSTTDWYEVVSIGAISSATSFVVDRALNAGAVTNATGTLGGALAHTTTAVNSAMVASNAVWVKATGTDAITASIAPPVGAAAAPSVVAGYTTYRYDEGQPTIQTSSGANPIFNVASGQSYVHIRNFIADCNSIGTYGVIATPNYTLIDNVIAKGFATYGISLEGGVSNARRCLALSNKAAASAGFYASGNGARFETCAAAALSCPGFYSQGRIVFDRCVSANHTGASSHCFLHDYLYGSVYNHCVAYGAAGDGIKVSHADSLDIATVRNCILAKNGGYGINNTQAKWTDLDADYNAYWSNTSGPRNNVVAGANDRSLTVDPFANGGASVSTLADVLANFAMNTSGADFSTMLKGKAYPAYLDIGAVQHQDSGGGGTTVILIDDD